jgi:uracil-DNA glycosylase family 4
MTASWSSSTPLIQISPEFDRLVVGAQRCRRCPAMDGMRRVLSVLNGPVPAEVMLIGEAPGRRGAEVTGVPFAGDESGRRLDALLDAAGWSRADVFITNAVLCNPRDPRGNNRTPTRVELANCSDWLARQVDVVSPVLVVALGATALRALATIAPHDLNVRDAGADPLPWASRWLAAAYHPGARAAIHRPFSQQVLDFVALAEWLRARP